MVLAYEGTLKQNSNLNEIQGALSKCLIFFFQLNLFKK